MIDASAQKTNIYEICYSQIGFVYPLTFSFNNVSHIIYIFFRNLIHMLSIFFKRNQGFRPIVGSAFYNLFFFFTLKLKRNSPIKFKQNNSNQSKPE